LEGLILLEFNAVNKYKQAMRKIDDSEVERFTPPIPAPIISTIVVGRNCRATFRTSSDESRRVSCWRFSHRHKPAAAQSLALLPIRPEVLSLVQRWNCVPPRQWLATAGHYQWRWYLSLRGG